MRIEHVAWQVKDPVAAARWYEQHLGMRVVRKAGSAHFLADSSGRVLLEIYHNPSAPLMDYATTSPLVLHLCFLADDVAAERDRLTAAGATVVDAGTVTPAGDQMAMLRDPWGFPIQLARRAEPMPQG